MRKFKPSNHGTQSTSLSPHTLHIRNNIQNHTRENRKHWDLYRYLMDPYLLAEALQLVIANDGAEGIDGVTIDDVKSHSWECQIEAMLINQKNPSDVAARVQSLTRHLGTTIEFSEKKVTIESYLQQNAPEVLKIAKKDLGMAGRYARGEKVTNAELGMVNRDYNSLYLEPEWKLPSRLTDIRDPYRKCYSSLEIGDVYDPKIPNLETGRIAFDDGPLLIPGKKDGGDGYYLIRDASYTFISRKDMSDRNCIYERPSDPDKVVVFELANSPRGEKYCRMDIFTSIDEMLVKCPSYMDLTQEVLPSNISLSAKEGKLCKLDFGMSQKMDRESKAALNHATALLIKRSVANVQGEIDSVRHLIANQTPIEFQKDKVIFHKVNPRTMINMLKACKDIDDPEVSATLKAKVEYLSTLENNGNEPLGPDPGTLPKGSTR